MEKIKRLIIINNLKKLLYDNDYENFHFGSFKNDSKILLPEVDIVIDYINSYWFVYTSERGVFTTMKLFKSYESLALAIKNKQL